MRLLVTGGAGFIGSNFVRRITDGSFLGISSLIVLDKLTYAGLRINLAPAEEFAGYRFVEGDICDPSVVAQLIDEVDAVVNFAAESHVDRSISGSSDFVQTNIVGVQVLLDAIKNSGRKIRFLQVSTDEVYGSIKTGSWTEDSPLLPNSPYSASKASGELLARAYNRTHGLDILITRCSNNYGPNHFPEKLIPLFITNLIDGKKVPVYGDGKNIREWMHVSDCARGIALVLEKGKIGDIYNISSGIFRENLEVTRMLVNMMGKGPELISFVEDRKGHDFRYAIDSSKIRKELGWEPKVQLEEGLKETVRWFTENAERLG